MRRQEGVRVGAPHQVTHLSAKDGVHEARAALKVAQARNKGPAQADGRQADGGRRVCVCVVEGVVEGVVKGAASACLPACLRAPIRPSGPTATACLPAYLLRSAAAAGAARHAMA